MIASVRSEARFEALFQFSYERARIAAITIVELIYVAYWHLADIGRAVIDAAPCYSVEVRG
jgi:hypothetical protein